jgi:ubiquitin-protein ligase
MSDDENNDVEMEEEEDAAYDSEYCYESDGGGNDGEDTGSRRQDSKGTKQEVVANAFHVIMDPKAQTTEEWRAIYAQIRNLVLKSNRTVNYEWNYTHEEEFRTVVLYIQSFKERSCFYPFRVNFHATTELCFPEVPPQIQPLFSLPAPLFVMIYKHPLLTPRNWNPCQDLTITLEHIVSMLDTQIPNLETVLLAPAVGGGMITSLIRSAEEANKWLSDPLSRLSIEQLISFLYGYYNFEIPYHPVLLDQFITGEHILTAIPVNIKKELPKYSGIGYSRDTYNYSSGRKDTSNTVQQQQSAIEKVMTILKQKFEYFLKLVDLLFNNANVSELNSNSNELPINFENTFSYEIMLRFAQWIYDSPLLYIIQRNIHQMASGDIVRESSNTLINFDIALQLEIIYRRCLLTLPSSAPLPSTPGFLGRSYQVMDNNLEHLFEECYKKLHYWSKLDLFSDESQIQWFNNIKDTSDYWKIVSTHQEDEAVKSPERFKPSSPPSSSSSANENPQKYVKLEKNQVIYCTGIEKIHTHYGGVGFPVEKCNKFFLKELKTLNESLPEEITIFVAEEHPNYLIAAFYINNADSPYYGGMYLFHIMIPETYPEVSPKVQYMTTGYGTVRFNPNLYNNGKVCLSLLGTWSGEPWNPKTSNLNQVLSSILFLIFTEEPYYNEPGFDRDGRKYVKESQVYDGTVIGNMISYGILDHLIKPHPIEDIYQHIRRYFEMNWSTILPVLEKKIAYHAENTSLTRTREQINGDIQNIVKNLAK